MKKSQMLCGITAVVAMFVSAETIKWAGPTTGTAYWSDAANWNLQRVPSAGDEVLFQHSDYNLVLRDVRGESYSLVAASHGRIEFAEGCVSNTPFGAYDYSTMVFNGLKMYGCEFRTGGTETQIELAGGFSTNSLATPSATEGAKPLLISGGFHNFADDLNGFKGMCYQQTGGTVTGLKLNHKNGGTSLDMFYTINGGKLHLSDNQYTLGFGIDASGTADVFYDNTNGSSGVRKFWFSTFGNNHTVRVSDSASVFLRGLQMLQGPSTRATIDLESGTFRLGSDGMDKGQNIPDGANLEVIFNGGTWLYDTALPGSSAGEILQDPIVGRVGARGAKFDIRSTGVTKGEGLKIAGPLLSNVQDGKDGGLVKTGLGFLRLDSVNSTFTGTFYHRCGWLFSGLTSGTATPYGLGSFVLDGGIFLLNQDYTLPVVTTAGETFKYAQAAPIFYNKPNADVVIGNADATSGDDVLQPLNGSGVLLLTNPSNLGTDAHFFVNGGLECQENGRIRQPIFETDSEKGLNFLTYDKEAGAKILEGGSDWETGAAVAVSGAQSLAADTTVDAVSCLQGSSLTIADDAKLNITGDGSYAPLLVRGSTITGGAVNFGGARGYVVSLGTTTIASELRSSGGITFAGMPQRSDSLVRLLASNTYTGDTYICDTSVQPNVLNVFGSGKIYVCGTMAHGGQLKITSVDGANYSEINNDISVAGVGVDNNGALWFHLGTNASKTMNGDVELADDTTFGIGHPNTYAVFNGDFSGAGKLTLKKIAVPGGVFKFYGASTATGGLEFSDVQVWTDDPAKLGSGEVVVGVGATLKIENTGDVVFPQKVSGVGTILLSQPGKVTFADAHDFTGTIEYAGSSTIEVGTGGYKATAPIMEQNLTGSVDAGSLIFDVGADNSNSYLGTFSALNLKKTGEGEQIIFGEQANIGTTKVLDGTLTLTTLYAALQNVTVTRLDASVAQTITLDGERIVAWADADGRDIAFTNLVKNAPALTMAQINGHDALYLTGAQDKNEWLAANRNDLTVRAMAMVYAAKGSGGDHPNHDGAGWTNGGTHVLGIDGGEGLNTYNQYWHNTGWITGMNKYLSDADEDKPVTSGNAYWELHGKPQVLISNLQKDYTGCIDVGEYLHNPDNARPFYGHVGEVWLFNRALTEREIFLVRDILLDKWDIRAGQSIYNSTNMLNSATDIMVASGATLKLQGVTQEFTSINGGGAIVGADNALLAVNLASGRETFTGSVDGSLGFVKRGAGFQTLTGALTYTGATRVEGGTLCVTTALPTTTDVFVAEGATLDLNGQTLAVASLAGSGTVANGSLIVTGTIQPGGAGAVGTLHLVNATLGGGTLVLDGDATTATSDKLECSAGQQLSLLALQVVDEKSLTFNKSLIVSTVGAPLDTFASVAGLPANKWFIAPLADGIWLKKHYSTVIIIR